MASESHAQQQQTDVFSLSDQVLSDRLQFVEEIGFGNWGSVWLCRPKSTQSSPSADSLARSKEAKIAVKLVHRSKTPTTAARVRSLWNEMKIVRTFKNEPHPSIIPFHSFIITPSYALITMVFLPTLIPVEVDETKAKQWFRSLLSGVQFLHERGVVHNDIKPANILLSHHNVPVLVDFGFAEKYELKSSKAFHSNLSYGTPEYLSPERARGLPHDTRKSDVWSLGITFFEVLVGRTPFEYSDSEQFSTKQDLEKYWSRTLRGKWVGSWKMSKSIEKMLHRMVSPNADLRCTASEAMADTYWHLRIPEASHRRSSSVASSLGFEKDLPKLGDIIPAWASRSSKSKENLLSPSAMPSKPGKENRISFEQAHITRSKSQPKISPLQSQVQPKKRVQAPHIVNLSPIKGSPPVSPNSHSSAGKENGLSLNTTQLNARKPLGPRAPLSPLAAHNNSPPAPSVKQPTKHDKLKEKHRKSRVLIDLTGRNAEKTGKADGRERDRVKDRMKEWERERERLREMERLEEMEKERDEEIVRERELEERRDRVRVSKEGRGTERKASDTRVLQSASRSPSVSGSPSDSDPNLFLREGHSKVGNESGLSVFKHGLKMSIDKTIRLNKSSVGQVNRHSPRSRSHSSDEMDEAGHQESHSERESWEDVVDAGNSSLPVVRNAMRDELVAADNRLDRMNIWMRNVEKVVEDARQSFASTSVTPLPALPLAPLPQLTPQTHTNANRSSRLPRKVLAANQIFQDDANQTMSSATTSNFATANDSVNQSLPISSLEKPPLVITPHTPTRPRRATVSTRSPEPADSKTTTEDSPSKRREKSRSYGNLLQPISPISLLELNSQKQDVPAVSPRLSTFLDRSLFIAPPVASREDVGDDVSIISRTPSPEPSRDELTASPFYVEPYPPRKSNAQDYPVPDSPSQRRIEGVYDRFLMATTGVKRHGRGYESDNNGPVSNTPEPGVSAYKCNQRLFHSTRRAMPPPVSSDDQQKTVSVDELGVFTFGANSATPNKDEPHTPVGLVRRAFKTLVIGKQLSRRISRVV